MTEARRVYESGGGSRFDLKCLEAALREHVPAPGSSGMLRSMLSVITGAAVGVLDDELKVVFAEGDAVDLVIGAHAPSAEESQLRGACERALSGKRSRLDVQIGRRTFEVRVGPLLVSGAGGAMAYVAAWDVTAERYTEMRWKRKTRGGAELVALSGSAAAGDEVAQLLQQACDGIARTLEVDLVAIEQIDEETGHLLMTAGFGWPPEVIRNTSLVLTPERRQALSALAAGPEAAEDVSNRGPDGPMLAAAGIRSMLSALIGDASRAYGTIHVMTRARRSFNDHEAGFVQSLANILWGAIERSGMEESRRSAELTDRTTGLASRSQMLDRLRQVQGVAAGGGGAALLLINLDRFRIVTDAIGTSGGDALLRALSPRLQQIARQTDTVARLAGDEFALLCDGVVSNARAIDLAERALNVIAEPITLDGHSHVISASVGVTIVTEGGSSAEFALRDAATALHAAKEHGGNRVQLFSTDLRKRAVSRMNTESELRAAVEHQQLELHYQPIFSVPDQRLLGMEALVRWQHPQRGLVSPGEFIPLAEQTGLITQLGSWVLAEAARTAAGLAHPTPLTVSVNVSATQLRSRQQQQGLIDSVQRALSHTGLPAQALALEITESALMDTGELPVLAELKALGVQTMLDDFGTGHSSLGRLSEVPLDVLKIDRRFVSGLGNGQNREPIVDAIIAMASALDLRVIAEGIETETQWRALIDLGCQAAQGYMLARPMPIDELTTLVESSVGARAA
jgi:diguanylate cyclase (GGDEF)-like protein